MDFSEKDISIDIILQSILFAVSECFHTENFLRKNLVVGLPEG